MIKKALVVYGNLYIEVLDKNKLYTQGGNIISGISKESIAEYLKDFDVKNVKSVMNNTGYHTLAIYDNVAFFIYATGSVKIGCPVATRMARMSVGSEEVVTYPIFYASSNDVLNAPIASSDPYYVMGIGQYTDGWNIAYVCSNAHGRTNPYSRLKPTIVDESPVIELTADNVKRVRFSLNLVEESSIDNLYKTIVTNKEEPIKYYIPGWKRITDFIGYYHGAKMPITPLGYREIKKGIATTGKDYKTQIIPSTSASTDFQVGFEELYEHINEGSSMVDVLHHGVLLKSGNNQYWCTDFVNWKSDPIKNWTGDIQVFQFITNVQKNTDNGDVHDPDYFDWFAAIPSNELNPNPFIWSVSNEFPAGSLEFFVSGTIPAYDQGDGTFRFEWTAVFSAVGDEYRGGSASNVYVQLIESDVQLDYSFISEGFNIAKGETKRFSGSFTYQAPSSDLMKIRMIVAANNKDQYTARPIIQG